ncbi:MAG TPA: hypothetical protein ENI44_02525 [Thermoplasmatales archaeon]|nr:hypothetical protein [Thermoplasmatales archaeon]
MRKILIIGILAILIIGTIGLVNARYGDNSCQKGTGFVDEDGDGICDNYNGRALRMQNRYCNGSCYGMNSESHRNKMGFVDEDGDRMCDNYETQLHNQCCNHLRNHQ